MFTIISKYLPGKVVQGLTAAYFRVSALGHRQFGGAHSFAEQILFDNMEVKILPALSDNYMYLVIDKNTNQAAIVDPVNPGLVLEAVEQANVNLTKVLTTHHHWDHAGGNEELVKKCRNTLKVYGGDKRIGALTHYVGDGDKFSIGNINVECIFTPCHTTGHICYYLTIPGQTPIVFTGDTLFIAGCGRFFEGTAEQMYEALIEKLGNLPGETGVFCGHEYTVQNLKYALQVEPDNPDILKKMQWANSRRCSGQPTVPSTIMEEKLINPFMRVTNRSVQEYAGCNDPIATMKKIRTEKDSFK